MARGNKKKSKRSRQNARGVPRNIFKNQIEIVRYPFRCSSYEEVSSIGTNVLIYDLLLSNLGPRAVDAGVTFENFRISELDIRQVCSVTGVTSAQFDSSGALTGVVASGGVQYLAFSNEPQGFSGVPTSVTVDDLPVLDMGSLSSKLRLRIPRKGLYEQTGVKWYKTTGTGTPPTIDKSAGLVTTLVQLDMGVTINVLLVISGMLELCQPVAPTAALLRKQLALAELREKRKTFEHCLKCTRFVNGEVVEDEQSLPSDEEEKEYCKFSIPVCQEFSDSGTRSVQNCPH